MNELNLNITEEDAKEISVINDPFQTNCITNIWISFNNHNFLSKPHWNAKVSFMNGKTSGEQKTNNVDSFEEIVVEVKQILNSINKK